MRRKPAHPEDLDVLISYLDIDATSLPSPCIGICRVDPRTTYCSGCMRTIDEITVWGAIDDDGRRQIWRDIIARRTALRGPAAR
ncbi:MULTISPECIES: DUF1289 domain-containing protein [Oxalobacteraceae]|uniref:DUF1289 domain-containing protein n=1 Tax=Herminiimonas sp. Marseille-P9896 TaxID=2742211 RepID=UPI00158DAE7B|nr:MULTISPECIES: DUF1289 domain-containing protein [Oxalobacteraceae]